MAMTKMSNRPKEYIIPSRSYGITTNEAADVLVTSIEIKNHKQLYKAAIQTLKDKKKALNEIT